MSAGPAALGGLSAKGAIAPGRDADLVVFAPDESFVVDPARLHHRNPVTPYAGQELTGVVRGRLAARATSRHGGRSRGVVGGVDTGPVGRLLRREDHVNRFTDLPDLASRTLAGSVCAANDELFASRENLIRPEPPEAVHTFGHKGKEYDGWETRRRREPGVDWAIVRLGVPGVVRGVVVDTAYFLGNYPPHVSVEAVSVEGYPSRAELAALSWEPILEKSPAAGGTANEYAVTDDRVWTHVRLTIHPDGGVARFRVHGDSCSGPALPVRHDRSRRPGERWVAGRVLGRLLRFRGREPDPAGPGAGHGRGLGERPASRRRQRLGAVPAGRGGRRTTCRAGHVVLRRKRARRVRLSGCSAAPDDVDSAQWFDLVPKQRSQPDTRHRFLVDEERPVTHVRLDVYPDGGMARLRVWGELV